MEDQSARAAYLEDWLDTIEALPAELQRNFSLIRELDAMSQDVVRDIQTSCQEFMTNAKNAPAADRKLMLKHLTEAFTKSLKHGEGKVALATQTYDMIDRHIRRLDDDLQRFEDELMMTGPKMASAGPRESPVKRRRLGGAKPGKEAVKKEKRVRDTTPGGVRRPREPAVTGSVGAKTLKHFFPAELKRGENGELIHVDPNEPTYCICNQVSFGEMIACDNEDCDVEWFHYPCVGLDSPPKGKWYCEDCKIKLGLL